MVLLMLREVTLAFISIVIGNGLLLFGLILLLMGLEHFVGRPRRQIHNYLLLAVVVLSLSYFLLIRPDISIRTILLSARHCADNRSMRLAPALPGGRQAEIDYPIGGLGFTPLCAGVAGQGGHAIAIAAPGRQSTIFSRPCSRSFFW